jgi:hypothetical protein
MGSVTGLGVQADRARDELGPGWDLYTLISCPTFRSTGPGMIFTPDVQADLAGMIEVSKFYRGPDMKSIGV